MIKRITVSVVSFVMLCILVAQPASAQSGRGALGGAAGGALIGGLAGGGRGAAIGALVGAGTGAAIRQSGAPNSRSLLLVGRQLLPPCT